MEPVWHNRTALALKKFVDHPSHALIISGPKGAGKATTAEWLTRNLLKVGALPITPDQMLWISPDNKQIRIEQIREAQNFAKIKQLDTGVHRIIVLEQADTMADPAQNALLKLLEEPAPGVVLILLTEHDTKLKPTVMSRSQHIKILPLSVEVIGELAKNLSPTDLQRAWRISQGRAGAFHDLTKKESAPDGLNVAKEYLGEGLFERIAKHEGLKDRDDAAELVSNLLVLCRAALQQSLEQAKTTVAESWLKRTEACFQAHEHLIKNANVKLTLDLLALDLV